MNHYIDMSVTPIPRLDWLEPEIPLDEDLSVSAFLLANNDVVDDSFTIDYIYRLKNPALLNFT